jgi:hypothetical protein
MGMQGLVGLVFGKPREQVLVDLYALGLAIVAIVGTVTRWPSQRVTG